MLFPKCIFYENSYRAYKRTDLPKILKKFSVVLTMYNSGVSVPFFIIHKIVS